MDHFKKHKLYSGIKIATMSSMLFFIPLSSQKSYAVPVFDVAATGEIMVQTAERAAQFAKEMSQKAAEMAQEVMLSSQQMRNDFNRSMMEVGNITDVESETHNLMVMADLKPDPEAACTTIVANKVQGDNKLTADIITRKAMSNYASRNMAKAGESPRYKESGIKDPVDFKLDLFDKLQELDENISSSGGSESTDEGEVGNNEGSTYLNPSLMFVDNLTEEEFEIVNTQKELIAGAPLPEPSIQHAEGNAYKAEFVDRARYIMLKSFSVNAIQEIISSRYTNKENGLSKIGSLEAYLDETVRNKEWVKKYTNANKDLEKLTTSPQVQRQIAAMQGKRLELEMMNYKQMEKIKGLLAIEALIEME